LILLGLAAVTAFGVPGPGDSALLAAGALAAQGRLNVVVVLVFAFVGYVIGCAIGYVVGVRGGRRLMERPGRTAQFRRKALAKGDSLFARFRLLAPVLVPAPIAGIHQVAIPLFMLATLVCALWWTLATGLAAYYLGEGAKRWLSNVGGTGFAIVGVVAAIGLCYRYGWQRRHRQRDSATNERSAELETQAD
jgi:membrane protein DedA with SNARE-associated domain